MVARGAAAVPPHTELPHMSTDVAAARGRGRDRVSRCSRSVPARNGDRRTGRRVADVHRAFLRPPRITSCWCR